MEAQKEIDEYRKQRQAQYDSFFKKVCYFLYFIFALFYCCNFFHQNKKQNHSILMVRVNIVHDYKNKRMEKLKRLKLKWNENVNKLLIYF
jgi:hypothetical protein